MSDTAQQYGRSCRLLVIDQSRTTRRALDANGDSSVDEAIELSKLRIKFSVKRSDTMTPNVADIRVYNLEPDTAIKIRSLVNQGKVILEAGYEGNSGVIFQGNIKQVILGREDATNTFIDIIAGDGARAYNFSVVNTTLAAGATAQSQVDASLTQLAKKGVTSGHIASMPPAELPRGKVMYGPAKKYLRNIAQTTKSSWSIQNEKVTFIANRGYLPGERVILTSKTGMIGTPQQTNEGVNVKCLLNPNIKIGSRIEINNASVERYKINLSVPNSPANIPAPLTADGVYYVLVAEHSGDTRGVEWYSSLICLNIDVTTNPINSVQIGAGGL